MQSSRFIFFFKIWAIVFATTLYFAQASIAQSHEQRLIPLLVPDPAMDLMPQQFRGRDQRRTTSHSQARLCRLRDEQNDSKGAGIAPQVDYRPIPLAREPEFDADRKRDLKRMPDLESFFTFGGTLELLTSDRYPPRKTGHRHQRTHVGCGYRR